MRQVYLGGTLINDIFLGDDRMDDVFKPILPLNVDYLVVAGGGSGGNQGASGKAGGGGAGGLLSGSASFVPNSYTITVGNGGIASSLTDAQNSSLILTGVISVTSTRGGRGGGGFTSGQSGGSGGGAGQSASPGGGTAGQGFDGGPFDSVGGAPPIIGGAGGGASGPGTISAIVNDTFPGAGASWLNGVTYARGGRGADGSGDIEAGAANTGNGGAARSGLNGLDGGSGVVIIRYLGTPKATGGTITQSGGYTYHTFTSNGTFTY